MTNKTYRFAAVAAVLLVLLVFASPVGAADITVPYDAEKTATQNGQIFFDTVMAADDGVTIIVPVGTYYLTDGQTSRITTDKTLAIIGENRDTTILQGEKYQDVHFTRGVHEKLYLWKRLGKHR